jgi:FtsP/CotA-like multicopper oxidase with cupredoxin domain
LPVPPVARPVGVDGTGAQLYRVTQRVAEAEILPGVRTPILGYDGIFPGPTFETRRGQPVVVRYRNELPVPTVVHLHGGHTPAEHDGWPLDLVLPVGDTDDWSGHHGMVGDLASGEREHRYPNDQRAATLWYHDHRMDFSGAAVYRGLAGFHLVRDDVEDALPLPRGERDLPLMICDRAFAADGSFAYPGLDQGMRSLPGVEDDWMEGVLGDVVLVNGAPWPVHEVDAARYRLRLLNASNARRYRIALTVPDGPDVPIVQIGSDGGRSRRSATAAGSGRRPPRAPARAPR